MNKRGMSIMMMFLLLLATTIGFAVQQSSDFNIEEFKGKLQWRDIELNVTESPDLGEGLEDGINGLGGAIFGIARWISELASENPDVPWKLILIGVILSILAPIILIVIKIGAIVFIFTREIILSRRERKFLKKMKGGSPK